MSLVGQVYNIIAFNVATINKRTVNNSHKELMFMHVQREIPCWQLPNHAGLCLYTSSPPELTYSSCYSVQCLGTVGPAKTREQTSILTWQHYCDIYSITISGITDMTIAMCMYCAHF